MRLRYFLAPAVLAAAFLPTADAQQSPLLKIEEQRQAAAMKKVEQAIREAVTDAQKLQQAGSTIRAGERLRQAMRLLDDPILKKESTEAWKTQLAAAMTAVDAGKKPELTEAPANPHKVADMARLKAMIEEDKEIRRGVDTVAALLKAGSNTQADKEIEALSKKYPGNPTVMVLPDLVSKLKSIDEVRAVHARQIENIRLAMLDLQKTATMAKVDYELPADWKEITERRKPKISAEMRAIMTSLRTPVSFDLTNAPLSEVLKALSDKMKQPINLDKATMQEVGIDRSTPTTLSTPSGTDVQARTALKMALANHGLTYIVRNNTIQVVTREKAAQTMETRVYYIGDMVMGTGPVAGGAMRFGTEADRLQAGKNAEAIMKQIRDAVDPASWKNGGSDGKGEITYHPASMALVVKASAEIHGLLSGSLGK